MKITELDKKLKDGEKLRVSILSNFTIDALAKSLKEECLEECIDTDIEISPYSQYAQQIVEKTSALYKFSPKIIFIILDIENLLGDFFISPYSFDGNQREKVFNERFEEIENLLKLLEKRINSKIVVNSLLLPINSSKGILENKEEKGIKNLVGNFNKKLENLAINDGQLFIFDTNNFCMKEGYSNFVDKRFSYIADMKLSTSAIKNLAKEYLAYIFPLESRTKKCLVLDMDNTLWGGIVGEVGIGGIKLGPNSDGKPFYDFQKKILELFERGIILAINSKNNLDDAMEVIRNHKYMILKENNFACLKINWQDKVTNMIEIAKELNIGLDSFVFIDDDPSNRELVKKFLPEVKVVDLPKEPALYCGVLDELKVFNLFNLTNEDLERGKMYVDQKKRNFLKDSLDDLNSFIEQLDVKYDILDDSKKEISRIAQITQKTNQFNLTTKRYSEEEILKFIDSENFLVKSIRIKDKFGDYGLSGLAIIRKAKDFWEIDSFLLSCRVLGKKIEFSFIDEIKNDAKSQNIKGIIARFIPTKKNSPAKAFLNEAGFKLTGEQGESKEYLFEI